MCEKFTTQQLQTSASMLYTGAACHPWNRVTDVADIASEGNHESQEFDHIDDVCAEGIEGPLRRGNVRPSGMH